MTNPKNKRVTDAMTLLTGFIAEYDIDPESAVMLIEYMKDHDLDFTHANLTVAYKTLCEKYFEWEAQQQKMKQSKLTRDEVNSWTSQRMKEELKDDNRAAEIEWVLSQPLPKVEAPKPQPKPKAPVRSTEEQIIEAMSSKELARALADPVKAKGIEKTLALAESRR
jgi:hypothetical protein